MDLDALPAADELWWHFAVATAIHAGGTGNSEDVYSQDVANQVLSYSHGSVSISIQRLYRGRVVLWGRTDSTDSSDHWTGIPGWATSDAVHDSLDRIGATFLLWHARDGWESATDDLDLSIAMSGVLSLELDAATLAAARTDALDDEDWKRLGVVDIAAARAVIRDASGEAPPVQGTVRNLLAMEIEAQMRRTRERDRLLPQRPVPLVRWSQVAEPPAGFTYSVRATSDGLARTNDFLPRLPKPSRRSLDNVLLQLHIDESTPSGGAWLFARVRFNGVQVQIDRAFDSQPAWARTVPSLEDLSAEMERRDPAWRPAWARLLPPSTSHPTIAGPPGQLMA